MASTLTWKVVVPKTDYGSILTAADGVTKQRQRRASLGATGAALVGAAERASASLAANDRYASPDRYTPAEEGGASCASYASCEGAREAQGPQGLMTSCSAGGGDRPTRGRRASCTSCASTSMCNGHGASTSAGASAAVGAAVGLFPDGATI